MNAVFAYSVIVKAVMLALGILAWRGNGWAFALFVAVAAMAILFDILVALVASSADKDIERNTDL